MLFHYYWKSIIDKEAISYQTSSSNEVTKTLYRSRVKLINPNFTVTAKVMFDWEIWAKDTHS